MVADTMGGRVLVRWDDRAQATAHGQIVFFAELLATAGVFDRWVQDCPLRYSSPNASRPRDVLGTLMLGILAGSKRYAHIAGVRGDAVAANKRGRHKVNEQLVLALAHDEVHDNAQVWEYPVLATNAPYDIAAIGQLYRDRCDCENGFDELKNQWGWGGLTTHDMHRSQVTARAVALVYNCWSWYVRAADPQARREALTSRPLLLAAVGRATNSANQTTLYLTPMHADAGLIKAMIANVHAAIQHLKAAAEQLPKLDRWRALLAYICQRIVGQIGLPVPPPPLSAPG
jgi:hypothetical protein